MVVGEETLCGERGQRTAQIRTVDSGHDRELGDRHTNDGAVAATERKAEKSQEHPAFTTCRTRKKRVFEQVIGNPRVADAHAATMNTTSSSAISTAQTMSGPQRLFLRDNGFCRDASHLRPTR